jgi:hypothetical protein
MKAIAQILIVTATLCGCEVFQGVIRESAEYDHTPQTTCVMNAISTVPGITNVAYHAKSGGRPITMHGIEKADLIQLYDYKYEGLKGSLWIVLRYDGHATLQDSFGCLNCRLSQSEVNRIYPAILQIEHALEAQCGMVGLRKKMHEYCRGVTCGGT